MDRGRTALNFVLVRFDKKFMRLNIDFEFLPGGFLAHLDAGRPLRMPQDCSIPYYCAN